jgi:hypothetical protein
VKLIVYLKLYYSHDLLDYNLDYYWTTIYWTHAFFTRLKAVTFLQILYISLCWKCQTCFCHCGQMDHLSFQSLWSVFHVVAGLVPQVKSAHSSTAHEARPVAMGPSPSVGWKASTWTDPVHCTRVCSAARVHVSWVLHVGVGLEVACDSPGGSVRSRNIRHEVDVLVILTTFHMITSVT